MTQPFRFGLQVRGPVGDRSWADTARFAEQQGYSSLLMPDHFHEQWGPLTALSAAAAATTELRVGALVFGNDYRHPVVLAKEIATLDHIAEGRVEFGLGAGWMRTDYDQAGMTYDPPGVRIERMVESLEIIKRCWADGSFDYHGEHFSITGYDGMPAPYTPGGPPVIIGGGGPRMLRIAATHGHIVGITANLRAGEVGSDAIADSMPEAYDAKLDQVRTAAGERSEAVEISSLTMNLSITEDRDGALSFFSQLFSAPEEVVAQSPALLVGSVGQIIETLQERRERWGFSYVVVQENGAQGLERFDEVIAALAGT